MTPSSSALGKLSPEGFDAAMAVPVSEGPVVFIGSPWLVNDPRTGEVKGFYRAPSVTHGSQVAGGR